MYEIILKGCLFFVVLIILESGFDERFFVLREKCFKVNYLLKNYVEVCKDKVILCDLLVKLLYNFLNEEDCKRFWYDGFYFFLEGYVKMVEIIFEDIKYYFMKVEEF